MPDGAGAVYVPFIGDGDLAVALYAAQGRKIYGADLNPARVARARERLPEAVIRLADCDGWPFSDVQEPFALADFDAYSNPYPGFSAFWTAATAAKCERIVIFGTDGLRQRIKRAGVTKMLPGGEETKASISASRAQFNRWWTGHVLPYLRGLTAPARITRTLAYTRKDMLYWVW